MILLSIQCNLAAGTLAPYAESRPELRPLLKQILDFNISYVILLQAKFFFDFLQTHAGLNSF